MENQDRTIPKSEVPKPPQPPEVGRSLKFHWYQWVGIPLIFLVVALALFGVFGESFDEAAAGGEVLSMRVEYPSRFRYKQINPIRVWVTNRTTQPIDTATVSFDEGYILEFSNVSFIPSAKRPFQVEVTDLKPGETRLVLAGLQAEQYGRHAGEIAATAGGPDTVRARVSTLVYP
jgi:hypothetical protein